MEKHNIESAKVGGKYLIYIPETVKIEVFYTDNYNQGQTTRLEPGFYETIMRQNIHAIGQPKYFNFYHDLYGDIEIDNPEICGAALDEIEKIRETMKQFLKGN